MRTNKKIDRFAIKSFLNDFKKNYPHQQVAANFELDFVIHALNQICDNNISPNEAFTRKIPLKEIKKRHFFYALYVKYVAKWIRKNTQAKDRPVDRKPTDIAKEVVQHYTGEDLKVIIKAYKDYGLKVDKYPEKLAPNVKPLIKMMKTKIDFEWLNS